MAYWLFKWLAFTPLIRVLFRPWVEGESNIPSHGPAILACNHLSAGDTFLLPAMIKRRLTFPAKLELFHGTGVKGRVLAWFLTLVGQKPMDRSGGRASASGMESVLEVLRSGRLLGIFPEGTRSPDGRLYKGKTGAARLVLQSGVPVIPIGFSNTQFVRSPVGIPIMWRPGIRIGKPMDFSAYAAAGSDRDVLRYVTDEIMAAIMDLSGQIYVDAYATSVRAALAEGRELGAATGGRPGAGRPVPPVPSQDVPAPPVLDPESVRDVSA